MTACSLINFAIKPRLLKGEIDSSIKSDRTNKYLNIIKSVHVKHLRWDQGERVAMNVLLIREGVWNWKVWECQRLLKISSRFSWLIRADVSFHFLFLKSAFHPVAWLPSLPLFPAVITGSNLFHLFTPGMCFVQVSEVIFHLSSSLLVLPDFKCARLDVFSLLHPHYMGQLTRKGLFHYKLN